MPGHTANRNLPYPLDDDPVQPPEDIQALAQAVDQYQFTRGDVDPSINLAAGVVTPYMGTIAPPGWLLLDGSTIANANNLYPDLWAAVAPVFKSGNSLVLPDLRFRTVVGPDSFGTAAGTAGRGSGANTIGATGGSQFYTIPLASIPAHNHDYQHTHVLNHDHPAVNITSAFSAFGTSLLWAVEVVGSTGQRLAAAGEATGPFIDFTQPAASPPLVDIPPYPPSSSLGLASGIRDFSGNSITPSSTGLAGSGTPMNFMNPYICLLWIVKT